MQVNNQTEPAPPPLVEYLVVGSLSLNRISRVVSIGDRHASLTTAEFELLVYLLSHPGQVVSRDELFQRVLGVDYNGTDRTIDLRMSRLRRKLLDLGSPPRLIKSIRCEGYFLTPNPGE